MKDEKRVVQQLRSIQQHFSDNFCFAATITSDQIVAIEPHRHPTTDHRSPITDYRLPTDYRPATTAEAS